MSNTLLTASPSAAAISASPSSPSLAHRRTGSYNDVASFARSASSIGLAQSGKDFALSKDVQESRPLKQSQYELVIPKSPSEFLIVDGALQSNLLGKAGSISRKFLVQGMNTAVRE